MKFAPFAAGFALCAALSQVAITLPGKEASNEELNRLYREDQADREPKKGQPIDWVAVMPRDKQRRNRVLEMYRQDLFKTGDDYYNAAMVLQHGEGDDQLSAHEFCVAAIVLGKKDAKWLAVASEDRWLQHIGRKQRFGTQYTSDKEHPRMTLSPVEDGVTDSLRKVMHAPSLAEAKKREDEINKLYGTGG